ncbi:MAG: asparaginase [Pyrinomonadaceae bacterium]
MPSTLARVYRNGILESVHRGSIVVVDGAENVIRSVGDPEMVTFWRSSAKAFQALPFVACGGADAFGYSEHEIALACASHSGENFHVETARGMLSRAGFFEHDLQCGPQVPFDQKSAETLIREGISPSQLHNNCSGKHAAMLAFAKHIGTDPASYLDLDGDVQKRILEIVSKFTSLPRDEIGLGTDGCSAPNFAVSLRSMAVAYLRLVSPPSEFGEEVASASKRIVAAATAFPEYVGGSERLDTKVMRALKGNVFTKVGAEGVWTVGILPSEAWPKGAAFALKIDDGDDFRARPAVGIEILRRLGLMTPEAEKELGEFSPIKLKNRNEIEVGEVVAEIEF